MIKSKWRKSAAVLLLVAVLSASLGVSASAASVQMNKNTKYKNPDTGFCVYIYDDADLLSEEEETALVQDMIPVTDYGHVIFWSTTVSFSDVVRQARNKRMSICGDTSSCIFSINMSVRKVTVQSDGKIYEYITRSYARTITDNVSRYASSGDYYKCAAEAYSQMLSVMKGNRIAEPMKYISFIVIGFMLSFVLVAGVLFSKKFNPLVKQRHNAIRTERGEYVKGEATFTVIGVRPRTWVTVVRIMVTVVFFFFKMILYIIKEMLEGFLKGEFSGNGSSGHSGGRSSGGGGSSRGGGSSGSSGGGRSRGGGGGSSSF